ncbi:MAG: class I SAM-dependent methyltransferase [Ignavibacteria bacterium]
MLFEKYYYPPVNFHSVWFSEMMLRNLNQNGKSIESPDVILDIGCGLGNHCFSLLDYDPKEIQGYDISKETIDLLNSFNKNVSFKNVDICKDDISGLKETFTVIFSSDVYEHVDDPQVMLNNVYFMLKPGGEVSITFPNLDDHGHNQLNTVVEFKSKLEAAGFRNYKIKIVDGLTLPYKVLSRIYIFFQNLSDKMMNIKRNKNRMPESDEFHEMYAFKKISKIRNRTLLIRYINFNYDILKRICRLSSVYRTASTDSVIKNKRFLFWAKK